MAGFKYSMESFMKDHSHEYQRTYNFEVRIDKVHIIPSMVVNITLPKISIEPFPFNWSAAAVDLPSKATFEPVVLTLKENIDGEVYNELYNWYNECLTLKDGNLMIKDFENIGREGEIIALDNKGQQRSKWKLHFCYLLDSPGGSFSYTENDVIHYEVVIRYVSFEFIKG